VRAAPLREIFATAVAALLAGPFLASAADFYASPTGTASTGAGTGTITNPWALQTALSQPAAVHAGDTIWLRGGTYVGRYTSYLSGSSTQPIVVRSYPGEWARVDGGPGPLVATLTVAGQYTWYWGFEIFSSDTKRRSTQNGSWPTDLNRGSPIFTAQDSVLHPGIKIINMVIHDGTDGISAYATAPDMEIYGNLIFNNGWDGATDRGHGHGIYAQNQTGTKTISDNIIFNQYGEGINIYGSASAFLDNISVTGNTVFDAGLPSIYSASRNLLFGAESGSVAHNGKVDSNSFFWMAGGPATGFFIGYAGGTSGFEIRDNWIVAMDNNSATFGGGQASLTMTGNHFYRNVSGISESAYPSNTYHHTTRPTGTYVIVRPNAYEAGRGHITVFNWDRSATVAVDVSSILTVGTSYEVRNAQNYFAAPVLTGTYAGGTLTLPMSGLSVAAPIGATAPPATGPDFNAFVVLPRVAAPPPPPVASFTFSPASPQTNAAVAFTDTSSGGPTGWLWNFGDGTTSTVRSPTHTYAIAGTYTARLTASNAGGSTQATSAVTVTAPPLPTLAAGFYPLAPCRLIDTRNANGPAGGPAIAANGSRSFAVTGRCGIPANAWAISANVAVPAPAASGPLQIYPGNFPAPQSSVISFRASRTRANNLVVALSTDGTGTILAKNGSTAPVHVVLDVTGYFR
jgi:PKD repeat protein